MPLQLAFSAWAMRDLPLEQQIDIVRRAGYVGICLVSDPHFASLDPATTSAAERRRVRALLDSADLALTAIAGHANLLEPDPRCVPPIWTAFAPVSISRLTWPDPPAHRRW